MKKNLFTVMVMLISFPVSAEMSKAEAEYYANACFSTVKLNEWSPDPSRDFVSNYTGFWYPREINDKWEWKYDISRGRSEYMRDFSDGATNDDITVIKIELEYTKPWGEKYIANKYCSISGRKAYEIMNFLVEDKYFSSPKS